ncbi:pilus assembly protein TadG-related protein [Qipengyuania sp. NPDC077410]|uniref:pilus assembly protein TadG-related protein n=1 Tax=Qipengyuania sp. NPDC077410 TaxID=3364496 RepID=UPI0037CB4756
MVKFIKGLLARLRRSEDGNVLPLLAAALIPILVVIGGGVDYARASLAKAKLQEAVDSAALAGRRVMSQDNIETARPHVEAFMRFNYPDQTYGTEDLKLILSKPDVGVVRVRAETKINTTLLALVGLTDLPIVAEGEATQNLDNVDIMLVLDTTGSMDENLGGQRKIEALQQAVKGLYNELKPAQTQLKAQNLRLRIGVVPYSSTVNVGKQLNAANPLSIRKEDPEYYHWNNRRQNNRDNWYFEKRTYNLTNYVNNGTFGSPNGHNTNSNVRWKGCVEERSTVSTITANDSRNAAPTGANDLDIDMLPSWDKKTQWQPYVFDPLNGNQNLYCPSEVTLLAELNSSDIDRIVGALDPQGSTYHDVGMIWGTRLISGAGVFGGNNPTTYNGRPVNRHIIYMTDGEMSAPVDSCARRIWIYCSPSTEDHSSAYSGYGIEYYDKRVGGNDLNDNNGRHTKRFSMACNAAKAKNISVWTISFGTGKVDSLTRCASNEDQAFTADNSSDLITKFAEIGRNIGALRLSR